MLINCISCGKTISTKLTSCPYCATSITSLLMEFGQERKKGSLREKYKGSIFALTLKEHKL